jgi:hypothetical protein
MSPPAWDGVYTPLPLSLFSFLSFCLALSAGRGRHRLTHFFALFSSLLSSLPLIPRLEDTVIAAEAGPVGFGRV